MDSCWNRDYRNEIIRFLEPAVGKIQSEYLTNDEGCIAIEMLQGNPNVVSFIDRSRIARCDFNLYTRANGRDTQSRKSAMDLLMTAAKKCVMEAPFEGAYIELCEFPHLFNRNMSGNEEYQAGFSLFFTMRPDDIPLNKSSTQEATE
ncbi:MAG: hypothetical protein IJC19_00635 [Clostridia bacterium]|nr:hypothetical protein [Clostridia bacterium]